MMNLAKSSLVVLLLFAVVAQANAATRASAGAGDRPIEITGAAPKTSRLAESSKPFKDVDVQQFDKLRSEKNSLVLDVRTKKEFDEGHIPGAINIDVNAPDFESKAAKLDKSKAYLVHCASGIRSVKACNKLAPLEFKHLYNLEGGFRAWQKAAKPVQK